MCNRYSDSSYILMVSNGLRKLAAASATSENTPWYSWLNPVKWFSKSDNTNLVDKVNINAGADPNSEFKTDDSHIWYNNTKTGHQLVRGNVETDGVNQETKDYYNKLQAAIERKRKEYANKHKSSSDALATLEHVSPYLVSGSLGGLAGALIGGTGNRLAGGLTGSALAMLLHGAYRHFATTRKDRA